MHSTFPAPRPDPASPAGASPGVDGHVLTEVFPGQSEVAALMRGLDWAATPFGAVETWPQSLRTVVRILLTSRFAMWMGWGPDLTFLYNDAYRHMTLGTKHPWALARPARELLVPGRDLVGQSVREVLPELVEQGFGKLLDDVYATGVPHTGRAAPLVYDRRGNGVPEEVFFTFVYHPIRRADGTVVGVFVVASDVTEEVRARERAEQLAAELEAERDHLRAEVGERRRAEALLTDLNETLEARVAARTAELERTNTTLEQRNRELQEFTYVASHDLQEPLRKVSTFADLLRHDYGGPSTRPPAPTSPVCRTPPCACRSSSRTCSPSRASPRRAGRSRRSTSTGSSPTSCRTWR